MVQTPGGLFLARYLSPGPRGNRIGQKQALKFWQHFADRLMVQQQRDDLAFERMKTDRMIDLRRILSFLGRLAHLRSVFGHMSIIGRANLDLSDLVSGIIEVKVKTIENTAKFFQLPSAERIRTIDEYDLHRLWSREEDREWLLENTRLVAKACLDVAEAAISYPIQLSAVTCLPLDQVMAAAVGFRVDSYFVRKAHQIGELVPIKNEQSFFTYPGRNCP